MSMVRQSGGKRRIGRTDRGFTLIETALTTVIVGVGVLAMVSAFQSFHRQNHWSSHASIAERLGNEIRELTLNLPRHDPITGTAYWGPEPGEVSVEDFNDLDDFAGDGDGVVFSADLGNGPINARREVIPNMNGWGQYVRVYNVDPFDISGDEALPGSTPMMVVEVVVTFRAPGTEEEIEMTRVTWLAPQ